ncbi:MAG TPA: molybdenum ABC transporter permease [Bacteroidia bacterium]|nr:molybdenum ABC transporter permease [Bacteroidia bacterium]
MDSVTAQFVFGIISFVIAIVLLYWINRRKFYRRNMAGIEGFSSFETSVLVRFLEAIGKLLAYALIIFGIFLIWTHFLLKKYEKKQQKQNVKIERSR